MSDFLSGNLRDNAESTKQNGVDAFVEHASDALRYGLFQAPITGAAQLVDHVTGSKLEESTRFCDPPQPSTFGSSAWFGDLVGGTAATGLQFAALHRMVGAGAAAELEMTSRYGLRSAMPAIGRSMVTGAVFGGVFTPVSNEGDFMSQRLANSGISALNFGVLTAGSVYLKSTGSKFFANDIVANSLPGIPAGLLHADLHSLALHNRTANWSERTQSIANYTLGGAMAGGANILHEHYLPTSGIKGVRSLADIKMQADLTIKSDHPAPFKFADQVYRPPNADQLVAEGGGQSDVWHERTTALIREELENSSMPLEHRKLVISEHQALAGGLEALLNRPAAKPIMTVYGSARLGKDSRAGQEARWLAGLAAENGFDVMTGGAPTSTPYDGGLMGMASMGAYESNANVIAVTIKLPFEAADAPDGFHTLTIQCRNFPSRMIILRQVDHHDPSSPLGAPVPVQKRGFFVVGEPGIGTLAEFFDLVTQMQTGKIPRRPVYVSGDAADDVQHLVEGLLKRGTISPKDLELFKIERDPRKIFADVHDWQAKIAAEETADKIYRQAGVKSPDRASEAEKLAKLSTFFKMPDATKDALIARLHQQVAADFYKLNGTALPKIEDPFLVRAYERGRAALLGPRAVAPGDKPKPEGQPAPGS